LTAETTTEPVALPPATADWVGRIKWTTLARVVALSGLLMFGIGMDLGMGPQGITDVPEVVLYQVVTAFFVLSFVALLGTYLLAAKFAIWLAWITLTVDVMLATSMVAITHGTESVFLFGMPLAVLSGAALLERKGAFVAASASSALLCVIALFDMQVVAIDMEPYTAGWLRSLGPRTPPSPFGVLVTLVVQVGALYGTALLSSKFVLELARARTREEAERRELAALRVRYEDVVSSLPDGLATVASNGVITNCNPAFCSVLGRPRQAVLGKPLIELLPELADQPVANQTVEILRPERDDEEPGEIVRHLDSRDQILAVRTARLRGPESIDGTIVLLRDITEVRAREVQHRSRERLAAIGEMAMAVAHEIRNPLASISGSVQMLKDVIDVDEPSRQLMDIAVRETGQLSTWIGDFLDFARPGKSAMARFDLLQVVREKLQAFQQDPRLAEYGVELEFSADESADYSVEADQMRIASLVWNLLTNALQAVLEVEDRVVGVELHARDEQLMLCVDDSGPGVMAVDAEHIFEPFFTTKGEGTGLGLALVRRIAERHGGQVAVVTGSYGGARFVVELPRRQKPAAESQPDAHVAA